MPHRKAEKPHNILDEPLHGFYIPTALFLVGITITTYMSQEYRILYCLPVFFGIVLVRIVSALTRLKSITVNGWHELELMEQTLISKNSAIYRFRMKSNVDFLDFAPGQHLAVRVKIEGKEYVRTYTPISPRHERGFFDIIVKSYPDGTVSKYFAGLVPGQTVEFQGPVGKLNYVPNSSKEIGFIAGGSGITPLLQLVNEIVTVPEDFTKIKVIYLNETENDILLREELNEMSDKYPNFQIAYVLHKPHQDWPGYTGYITKELMEKHLPAADDDNRLFMCGPKGMNDMALNFASELGWKVRSQPSHPDDQVFVF
ncbi:hypothetical protein TBLA_0B02970 [Henningerozyma blattae CBS 6284]|uniref:NADH-cytochrome b5 reductase n=1 Tax=Henningerozyma blattae (strain ATCC 34711 / CBS 6284 / DSM 70876 / NBRC 10599 / NRRL Y-10934 / UCD 77-7) TaxID=1071380 RepID=I2GYD7_HENB6|nr:hypothetical protein TBLA_0B02970 [Tetrapisispora blattae CBS 6284]CCH59139.1 hypothetical protein TBLA_0B02970 [Tetrapisispora blattae CBS 6284]